MKKTDKLPEKIYVIAEKDGDEKYLMAAYDTHGYENGQELGVYQLVSVKHVKVTEELV
jgi:hypothetical protein